MKKYRLNWRFWFFLIFFSAVVLLGIYVIFLLMRNQVTDYDEEMSSIFARCMGLVLALVLSTYLFSVISMIGLYKKNGGCGLTLTHLGIEDTVVFINLFAFLLVLPVDFIPWEAVTYYDKEDAPYIRVNTKKVRAGFMAKLILMILGYHFCNSFVKPGVTIEDLKHFEHRFAINDDN